MLIYYRQPRQCTRGGAPSAGHPGPALSLGGATPSGTGSNRGQGALCQAGALGIRGGSRVRQPPPRPPSSGALLGEPCAEAEAWGARRYHTDILQFGDSSTRSAASASEQHCSSAEYASKMLKSLSKIGSAACAATIGIASSSRAPARASPSSTEAAGRSWPSSAAGAGPSGVVASADASSSVGCCGAWRTAHDAVTGRELARSLFTNSGERLPRFVATDLWHRRRQACDKPVTIVSFHYMLHSEQGPGLWGSGIAGAALVMEVALTVLYKVCLQKALQALLR
eukprot:SM000019S04961  [mRNA]  locus=s19:271317:272832:+ [translate_table: standard]